MASLSSSVVQPSTVYATDVHDGRSNELIMREGEQEPSPSDPSAWLAWVLTLPSLTDTHCAKVCDVLDEVSDGGIADMVTVENSEQLFVYGGNDHEPLGRDGCDQSSRPVFSHVGKIL